MTDLPKFEAFPKIPRLRRTVWISEKIDGANAQVHITEDNRIFAGSRNRWITPADDNYGFAKWVLENTEELLKLGPGTHYGEWWGSGIQRRYGLDHKRFSLFNADRWKDETTRPKCCHVVPTLYVGQHGDDAIEVCLNRLRTEGSIAAPGFMRPEGIVIYHTASRTLAKVTLEKDHEPKGKGEEAA